MGLSSCAALKLAETGLFFKPVQFHLQPANLTIETLWLLMLHRWFWTALAFEKLFGIRLDGLLPLTNLNRVDPIFLANLIDRLQPLQRLKTDLGLELRAVNLAFLFTHKLLLIISGNSLNHCLKYGVHYTGLSKTMLPS